MSFLKMDSFKPTFLLTAPLILLILAASCKQRPNEKPKLNEGLFSGCADLESEGEKNTLNNVLFSIQYPSDWNEDNKFKQGLDISSSNFPDSLQRGFLLSVMPFDLAYVTKNPEIDYFHFEAGTHKGYEAIYLVRNDLGPKEDSTVYWRSELKLIDKHRQNIYLLMYGKRFHKETEPNWCEFRGIVESLEIIESPQ